MKTEEFPYTLMETLGAEGDILLGAFMGGFSDERGPLIGFSRDGRNISLINNGEPVFVIPNYVVAQNGARDFSLLYQSSSCRFYVAFTAGQVGHSGYFSIFGSLSLRKDSWSDVTDVRLDSVTGGTGTIWGPDLVEDDATGDIYAFVAACSGGNIGSDLRLYWVKFNDPMDLAVGHSAPVAVQVPAELQNNALNEVTVFRNQAGDGWLMQAFAFLPLNRYYVLQSDSLEGPWTILNDNMGMPMREGVFSLPLPDGGWRVYTACATCTPPNAYQFIDVPSDFDISGVTQFHNCAVNPPKHLENGKMLRVRTPLAPLFSQVVMT